jgi:predicted metal-dependent hydrolase
MQQVLPFSSPYPDPVFTRHPRARRYVIRVAGDGGVRVTVPRWGSKKEALAFAEAQWAWVERQRRRIEAARAIAPPWNGAVTRDGEDELMARARLELPTRLQELAAEHHLTVSRISIRNQRWRWGSCSPSGRICLNWRLVLMPAWVRDYVLIHELMHLRRMDHSARFWKLVASACPGYQKARQWLRVNQPSS